MEDVTVVSLFSQDDQELGKPAYGRVRRGTMIDASPNGHYMGQKGEIVRPLGPC